EELPEAAADRRLAVAHRVVSESETRPDLVLPVLRKPQRYPLRTLFHETIERISRARHDGSLARQAGRIGHNPNCLAGIIKSRVEIILQILASGVRRPEIHITCAEFQRQLAADLPAILAIKFQSEETERAVEAAVGLGDARIIPQQQIR